MAASAAAERKCCQFEDHQSEIHGLSPHQGLNGVFLVVVVQWVQE